MWLQCFSKKRKTDKLNNQHKNASKGKSKSQKIKNKVTWLENVTNLSDDEKITSTFVSETPKNDIYLAGKSQMTPVERTKDKLYCGTVQSHQVTLQKSYPQIITITSTADSDSNSDSGHDSQSNSISFSSYSGVKYSNSTRENVSTSKKQNLRSEILMAARTPSGTLPRAASRGIRSPLSSTTFQKED